MAENLRIVWRGQEIGTLTDYLLDMWYLEGTWSPNGSDAAQHFEALVREFTPLNVYKDHSKGTTIHLLESGSHENTEAVVISLTEYSLLVRRLAKQ